MKKIFILIFIVFLLVGIVSASTWVNDPNNCPTTAQAQSCSGSEVVCGLYNSITYCYEPSLLNPPSNTASSLTSYSESLDGGYILDCESYDGSAPHCDNLGYFRCERSETCYSDQHRKTTCTADVWGVATCGDCRGGYNDCNADGGICEILNGASCGTNAIYAGCDGSVGACYCSSNYLDCDSSGAGTGNGCEIEIGASCGDETGTYAEICAETSGNCISSGTTLDCDNDDSDSNELTCNGGNGCEITIGDACSVGSLSGTYDSCSGGTGNCDVTKTNFETGTETSYLTTDAILWGSQYGTGYLINMTDGSEMKFGVNKTGCVVFADGTTQCTGSFSANLTNVAFYNQSNTFSENQTFSKNITVTNTGFFGWLGSLSNRITGLFVQDIDFIGNINGSGNFTTTGRVGIGTENPDAKLDIRDTTTNKLLYIENTIPDELVEVGSRIISQINITDNSLIDMTSESLTGLDLNIVKTGDITGGGELDITGMNINIDDDMIMSFGDKDIVGLKINVSSVDVSDFAGLEVNVDGPSASDIIALFNSVGGNGRVGIGTTTPSQELHVVGDGLFTGNVAANYFIGNGSSLTDLSWTQLTNVPSGFSDDVDNNTLYYADGIYIYNNGTNYFFLNETKLNETISTLGIALGFNLTYNATYEAKADYQFGSNNFNGSGNVTASYFIGDGSKLSNVNYSVPANSINGTELADTINLDANMNLVGEYNFSVDTSDLFVNPSLGRVGIGTTSPYDTLHVDGRIIVGGDADSNQKFRIYPAGSGTMNYLQVGNASGGTGANLIISGYSTLGSIANFSVHADNSDFAGNVGIGTDTPNQELQVVGDINISGIYYGNGSGLTDLSWTQLTNVPSGFSDDVDNNTLYYANGIYIYNNGTDYFFLNETKLNETIEDLILINSTNGVYIYDSGEKVYLNETKLNTTISTLGVALGFNSTYNVTYNTWAYNQTTLANTYTDSVVNSNNASWSSTYNATYESKVDYQFTNNNFNGSGNFTTSGNVTASYFIGDGSKLSNVNYSVPVNSINGTELADTINLDASMNIIGEDFAVNTSDLFVDVSTGRIGIGTTTPEMSLDIAGGGILLDNSQTIKFETVGGSNANILHLDVNEDLSIGHPAAGMMDAIYLYGGGTRTMTVAGTGKVGIGTTGPDELLHVNGNAVFGLDNNQTASKIRFLPDYLDDSYIQIGSNNTDPDAELRITKYGTTDTNIANFNVYAEDSYFSGNVGIGTDSPQAPLHINSTSNETLLRLQDSDGTCIHNPETGSETISCSSDEKLKENIHEAESVLEEFEDIEVRDYTVKASGKETTGAIAQELSETHPEMVHEEEGELFIEQPNPWKLLKAIQELKERFDALVGGNYSIEHKAVFNEDMVGTATVLIGETEVEIVFDEEYEVAPIITATPIGLPTFFYGVDEITNSGFKILISGPQEKKIEFNWHAFAQEVGEVVNVTIETNLTQGNVSINKTVESNLTQGNFSINETVEEVGEVNQSTENITEKNNSIVENEEGESEEDEINETIEEVVNQTEIIEENLTIEDVEEKNFSMEGEAEEIIVEEVIEDLQEGAEEVPFEEIVEESVPERSEVEEDIEDLQEDAEEITENEVEEPMGETEEVLGAVEESASEESEVVEEAEEAPVEEVVEEESTSSPITGGVIGIGKQENLITKIFDWVGGLFN